jgi:hypothetical protein
MACPPEAHFPLGLPLATTDEAAQLVSDALLGPRAKGIPPRWQVDPELRRAPGPPSAEPDAIVSEGPRSAPVRRETGPARVSDAAGSRVGLRGAETDRAAGRAASSPLSVESRRAPARRARGRGPRAHGRCARYAGCDLSPPGATALAGSRVRPRELDRPAPGRGGQPASRTAASCSPNHSSYSSGRQPRSWTRAR